MGGWRAGWWLMREQTFYCELNFQVVTLKLNWSAPVSSCQDKDVKRTLSGGRREEVVPPIIWLLVAKVPICIILGLQGQSVLLAKCQMFLTT